MREGEVGGSRRRVVILGSTGSIGRSALDVAAHLPDRIDVVGLAAHSRAEALIPQILRFRPQAVAVACEDAAKRLRASGALAGSRLFSGPSAAVDLVRSVEADLVLVAVVGAAGLAPTLAALEAGRDVALATKEALVAGGHLVMAAAARCGRRVLPVDSEHNALFQCLAGTLPEEVAALYLTASGGPFRRTPASEFERITPEAALRHPTWQMGPKVTIDSATMMNKGLELIEARWLFGVPIERIRIIVHPQSIVHGLVEFVDGSLRASLAPADMRLPIQHALLYPARVSGPVRPLSLAAMPGLTFEEPDVERFPSLELARQAAHTGGTLPAVLNAANEVAVEAFLAHRISFPAIFALIAETMEAHSVVAEPDLPAIVAADRWAREHAQAAIARLPAARPRAVGGRGR